MVRLGAPIVLVAALGLASTSGWAPLQCGNEYDPTTALEETPGEALYDLATEFRENGDKRAWQRTLEHLIRRYPSSRFAVTARQDLEDAGITPPAADQDR